MKALRPWIEIWSKPAETIEQVKDSSWVKSCGVYAYILTGINAAGSGKIVNDISRLLDSNDKIADFIAIIIVVCFGTLLGVLLRFTWVNLIYYFGRIWSGKATKRNIDTVLALSLVPEIFKTSYLVLYYAIQGSFHPQISYGLTILCSIITLSMLVIGLSRVQKFTYGISILNLVVPQIALFVLYYSIHGM